MKKILSAIILLLAFSAIAGLRVFTVNSNSQTLSKINLVTGSVNNSFVSVGEWANRVYLHEDRLFIVNSGDNSVQVVDPDSGQTITHIHVADFSNPFAMSFHGDTGFVSGLVTGEVYAVDLLSNQVTGSIETGISPNEMLVHGDRLYLVCSGYQYPNYHPGELYVIDVVNFTVIETLELGINAQGLALDSDGFLHVVCTGNYSSVTGEIFKICLQNMIVEEVLSIGGMPWNIACAPNGNMVCGDAFGSGFYVYEPVSMEIIHGSADPFFTGGSGIFSNSQYIGLIDAENWMSNSTLYLIDYGFELAGQFTIGVGACHLFIETEVIEKVSLELIIEGQGYTNTPEGINFFKKGEEIELVAFAKGDYSFLKWVIDGVEFFEPEIDLIMDEDKLAIAVFVEESTTGEYSLENIFRAYPNPFSLSGKGNLNIDFLGFHTQVESIEIFDIRGRKVKRLINFERNGNISWNGTDSSGNLVKTGIYLLKMQMDDGRKQMTKQMIWR